MASIAIFVGIDIAKADFVVACRPDATSWTGTNDPEGIPATVKRLAVLAPSLIVLEATGGYETALVAALAGAALPVVVANPRQVRDFAKATGQLAKTDPRGPDLRVSWTAAGGVVMPRATAHTFLARSWTRRAAPPD